MQMGWAAVALQADDAGAIRLRHFVVMLFPCTLREGQLLKHHAGTHCPPGVPEQGADSCSSSANSLSVFVRED